MKIIMKIFLLISMLVISVSYTLPTEPVIFVNKSTVDYENAKILMDNLYSSREINVNGDNVTVVIKDINYIPAKNKLEINDNDKKLIIEFDGNSSSIRYKNIYCVIPLNFEKGEEVNLYNKSYVVEEVTSKRVILKEKDGREIVTNGSFEYGGYKVVLELVSSDLDEIVVDIYKNNMLIKKMVKLHKGDMWYLDGETLGIIYKNCTKKGRKYYFTFKVYSTIKIEEGEDYPLDNRFIVKEVNSKKNKIVLAYRNTNKLDKKILLFEYEIVPEGHYKDYVLFKVIRNDEKKVKVEDYAYIGGGIYAIKKGKEICIYYKGKKIKNHEKIYLGLVDGVDNNPLNINKDIILIGGPKVNKFVKELEDKGLLKVNITNKYPGNNIGVIQKIKNPYNGNSNIYILAGSNRWGTKAAILAFLTKYKGEDVLKVEWKKGVVEIR